jgi:prevent-host-death family protein
MKHRHQIGTYEAKTYLPKLLDKVAKGERFTITRHGQPIAMLIPVESVGKVRPDEAIDELLAFRRAHVLKKGSIRDMINEGRR